LGDAELLIPVMEGLPSSDGREAITWIVYPGAWDDETLAQSLEALSLQLGSSDDRIAIVGSSGRTALGLAERFFASRVRLWPDAETAIRNAETPLSGYLGPGVLLHDGRTAQILASMLRDASVASAACVVVMAEKRGKGWQVAPADSGEIANGHSLLAQAIWRANFPVSRPPRDLWLARTTSVTMWFKIDGALEKKDGAHVCTSFVAASYVGVRSEEQTPIRVPRAREDASTRVEALYG